jgi:poly-beta-1,6-N-acetyl-D-glucosamine synthase
MPDKKPLVSVLLTAWKEQLTIGRAIETLVAGFNDFELILGCPDDETKAAAIAKVTELGIIDKFVHIQDPGKGKPFALNLMMDKAQGEYWIFGDGDTYFGENVIPLLLEHFQDSEVMAVTGRPRSADAKTNMLAYWGHLLADAAHHRRTVDLTANAHGKSLSFVSKQAFFPVSGYLFAMRKTNIRVPPDCLVDDAYISYEIFNRGGKIAYEPRAEVFINYPRTLSDYFKQKKRSAGGYVQLWQYGVVKPTTKTRSFWGELQYFWFPIRYAQSVQELFWSLMLYPGRLWLWIRIYWERKVLKKDFSKTWVRVESTK